MIGLASWSARTFSSLRYRNYRLLWTGTLISNSGDWMDQIALNWFVVSTTGDPYYLALVNLSRAVPILVFTLIGGAVADRVERRKMLIATQASAMMLAFLLAAMVIAGHAPMWAVLLLAAGRGILMSFNMPARHSLISELVPTSELPNAVALNSMTINITKILGPGAGGLIIATLGTGACFLINGLSFLFVLWTLHSMKIAPRPEAETKTGVQRPRPAESLIQSVGSGLRYTWSHTEILLLVLVSLVPTFFGQPYLVLLTLFAQDVFMTGPEGLGLLISCAATGSVCGALMLAGMPQWAASPRIMLIFVILFGVLLAVFATTSYMLLALPLLFAVGALNIAGNASNNTILQLRTAASMRGRVLSIMLLNRGLAQLGAATSAAIAGLIGVQATVAAAGCLIVAFGAYAFIFSRLGRDNG